MHPRMGLHVTKKYTRYTAGTPTEVGLHSHESATNTPYKHTYIQLGLHTHPIQPLHTPDWVCTHAHNKYTHSILTHTHTSGSACLYMHLQPYIHILGVHTPREYTPTGLQITHYTKKITRWVYKKHEWLQLHGKKNRQVMGLHVNIKYTHIILPRTHTHKWVCLFAHALARVGHTHPIQPKHTPDWVCTHHVVRAQ